MERELGFAVGERASSGRWRARIVVGVVLAAVITLGVVPAARARDHLPRFTGRCTPAGPAYLFQRGSAQQGMYLDLDVSCTGTLDGRWVSGAPMRFSISGWPAVVRCQATSVAHADALLTGPTEGGSSPIGNDTGVMRIDNVKRTISFVGDHITQPLGAGSIGTIQATFKFGPPPPGACGTATTAIVSVTGSMVAN
jgi:hypothetical protein